MVGRIRACHAVPLAAENRMKLQRLFDALLARFDVLAGRRPLPAAQLDALLPQLLGLSCDVPVFAATAARARLEAMQAQLSAALAAGQARWLPARSVLLLRLFALMFPASDFVHPVLTPAQLLLGQLLAHCPCTCPRDAAAGVLTASLALQLAEPSARLVPEALTFLSGLVAMQSGPGAARVAAAALPVHVARQIGGPWLRPAGRVVLSKRRASTFAVGGAIPRRLHLGQLLSLPAEDPYFDSASFREATLSAACRALAAASKSAADLPAAHALLAPAAAAATALQDCIDLPASSVASLHSVLAACDSARRASPMPLRWHDQRREAARSFAPRFEEDGFVAGRDYDVDRERAEKRKLRRELGRSAKGAARELRKDNRFIAEERAKVVAARDSERVAAQRRATTFLQNAENDFKSGGQGGHAKGMRKGGPGGRGGRGGKRS